MTHHSKVLLVDDDYLTRTQLRTALERAGFDVLQADSGVRIVDLVLQERPDLVLMATRMALVDPFELTRLITGDPALMGVSVVFVGVDPSVEELQAAFEAGGEGFFPKPVDARAVLARVTDLTGDDLGPAVEAVQARLAV
jgi:DNA-binding response OmpR family regulator